MLIPIDPDCKPSDAGQGARLVHVLSKPVVLGLLLAVVLLATYWPVRNYEFTCYDDPSYFSSNPHVLGGFTWANVAWAFTSVEVANWHPLTWLSLMLDAELFGGSPIAPHLVNLLFHIGNTILLFVLLQYLTSAVWRSAIVAALFALHPLHVESVAWITERKDVLSLFFELLSLLAYAKSVTGIRQKPSLAFDCASFFDWVSLLFFVLALMSKPMAVTLPLLLLLLDWWPLRRITTHNLQSTIPRLVIEKAPYFILALTMSVITFIAQQKSGTVATLTKLSFSARIENAFVSYARYLGNTFYPVALAIPYPHPGFWPPALVLLAMGLFFGIGFFAIRQASKTSFFFTGWFWFVGTLVPVIGLVQVGDQAMADRYTYLPLIGIFIILAWGGAKLCEKWQLPRQMIVVATVGLFSFCILQTRSQLSYWENDGALFGHAVAVTRSNYTATVNLGSWFSKNGQIQEAMDCYHQALQIDPSNAPAYYNLGNLMAKLGNIKMAIDNYSQALQITPDQPQILNNLGLMQAQSKRFDLAMTNLELALRLKPDFADAQNNLGTILFAQKRFEEAGRRFYEAMKLEPANAVYCANLGDALVKMGNFKAAAECYQQAVQLAPDNQKLKAKLLSLGDPSAK